MRRLLVNLVEVLRHAVRPTVGVDTTGSPSKAACDAALAALGQEPTA